MQCYVKMSFAGHWEAVSELTATVTATYMLAETRAVTDTARRQVRALLDGTRIKLGCFNLAACRVLTQIMWQPSKYVRGLLGPHSVEKVVDRKLGQIHFGDVHFISTIEVS